jgi:hypothetical protein
MSEKTNVKGKEIVVKNDENSINTFITKAIEANAPIETMEKLFELHRKVKADFAREKFVEAMASFQSVCPVIEKKKVVLNKDKTTERYRFAPLDEITKQIKKPLADNGLYYKWDVVHEEKFVVVKAIVTHILGHSESSEFKVPISMSEYMTAPQSYASALTFAKRYSLLNVLGISTGEEDTDATTVGKPKAPKDDGAKILLMLRQLGKPIKTKEEKIQSIKDTTNLDPEVKGNIPSIVERLELLTKDEDISVQN